MNYTWNQFFIVVGAATVLYYLVVYVLFFLKKSINNKASNAQSQSSSNPNKNKGFKNAKPPHTEIVPVPINLIDTKVVHANSNSNVQDFELDETINEDLFVENNLQNEMPINTDLQVPLNNENNIPFAAELNQSLPDLSQINTHQSELAEQPVDNTTDLQFTNDLINATLAEPLQNEQNTNTVLVKEDVVFEGEILQSTLIPVEKPTNAINVTTELTTTNTENKALQIPNVKEVETNTKLSPLSKPKQVQSLMHLVQKK
jgi:hypothetical protein